MTGQINMAESLSENASVHADCIQFHLFCMIVGGIIWSGNGVAFLLTIKTDFLICDDTTAYRYSTADGTFSPLFDLQDSQVSDALNIDTIGEMEDGRIFIFNRSQEADGGATEAALLTPTPLDECPVQEVVTIGTVRPSTNLLNSVADFNRQNEDFNVSILNYSIGGKTYNEAREALKLDISLGKGPDICTVD